MPPQKFLIADDHSLYRAGVRQLLARYFPGAALEESADAAGTWNAVRAHPDLDLLLLDLAMPGGGGLDLLRGLAVEAPALPVAVLSASESAADARAVLEAGALGFIPKSSSDEVIVSAITLVLRGGVYIPPLMMQAPPPGPQGLTPRQRDVLALLAQGQSNKEIGAALGLSEATVKQHVSAILKALRASNRVQAVLAAVGRAGASERG